MECRQKILRLRLLESHFSCTWRQRGSFEKSSYSLRGSYRWAAKLSRCLVFTYCVQTCSASCVEFMCARLFQRPPSCRASLSRSCGALRSGVASCCVKTARARGIVHYRVLGWAWGFSAGIVTILTVGCPGLAGRWWTGVEQGNSADAR